MRLTLIFLLLGAGVANATVSYSQSASITVSVENKTVKEALAEIEKHSDYVFFYYNEVFDESRKVSIDAKGQTIESILDKLFQSTNNIYRINNRQIFISKQDGQSDDAASVQQAPTLRVTGKVANGRGQAIAGTTIIVAGTTRGVVSDVNGEYQISVPRDAVLTFSFLGYEKQDVVADRERIDVVMKESATQIGEVVVTGIADIPREDMVGSYNILKMDSIMKPAYSSLDQMLQGEIPGMVVTSSSMRAGTSPKISIRGQSTILGNTEPLWVIDGIIQSEPISIDGLSSMVSAESSNDLNNYISSQIAWLNPNDIETITVLKDASATAIYGSRASNGVIVITTKRGQADRFNVRISNNTTINVKPTYKNYNLMNSKERVNFSKEAYDSGVAYFQEPLKQFYTYEGMYRMYLDGDITEDQFVKQFNKLETVNTDWLDLLTRNAVSNNTNVSISGGTDKLRYMISASYAKDMGLEKGNDKERMTGRVSIDATLSPKIRLAANIDASMSETNAFGAGTNPLSYATTASRALPAYDDNGEYLYYQRRKSYEYNVNTKDTGLGYNILNELDNSGSKLTSPVVNATLSFKWNIIPELTYEFTGGLGYSVLKSEMWADANSAYIVEKYRGYYTADPGSDEYKAAVLPFGGELSTNDTFSRKYTVRNQLAFNKTFNKDHRVNANLAWEVASNYTNSKYNTVWGYDKKRGETIARPTNPEDVVPIGTTGPVGFGILDALYGGRWKSTNHTNNQMGLALITTYSYKNKYVLNANMRNDWSNRFGTDVNNRFDPTYSVGVLWRLSSEDFMKGTEKWLDLLNLKVTFGLQGNALTSVSPDMTLRKGTASTIYNDYTSSISQLDNPLLGWERTRTWNFGMDLSLFDGRLSFTLDGYTRNSNANGSITLSPEYGGFNTPSTGIYIRNSGIEGLMNVRLFSNKDWRVTMMLNASKNWNKVTKMDYEDTQGVSTTNFIMGQNNRVLATGYGLGSFWAYSFAGIDQATGYPMFNYMDLEDAGYTDFLDYAGNKNPSISGGLSFRVSYKTFSLYTMFSGIFGHKAFLPNPYSSFYAGKLPDADVNLSKELTKRWKEPGDTSNIPGLYTGHSSAVSMIDPSGNMENMYTMWANSTERVVPASFVKCKTISLTWYNSAKFWQKLGISNISVTGSANNLFVLASKRWNGMDPEYGGTYVSPASYTIGVTLTF